MSDGTKIEWAANHDGSAGATWNPIRARHRETGAIGWHCTHASTGCGGSKEGGGCYAEAINRRLGTGLPFIPQSAEQVEIFLDEAVLLKPLSWKKPRTIFVCSMTDLFGDFVSDDMIDRVFAVAALAPRHTFIVLTKRARRMRAWFAERWQGTAALVIDGQSIPAGPETGRDAQIEEAASEIADRAGLCDSKRDELWTDDGQCRALQFTWPLPNVWLGVSAERQREHDERKPDLEATPASVRFLSIEPLIAPIAVDLRGLDWIIVGGESGPKARPMHPDWARDIRDQCAAAGVKFFFKQWGEWREVDGPKTLIDNRDLRAGTHWLLRDGRLHANANAQRSFSIYHDYQVARLGKRNAGRMLDGRTHDERPLLACQSMELV